VRGSPGQNWCTPVPGLLNTPNGFWLSPGKMTLSELKKLLDISVKHRSFFHPWMHLVECDLNCNDLENFYYPFFSYVKELESKNQISILSFAQIEQQFFSNPQKNLEVNL